MARQLDLKARQVTLRQHRQKASPYGRRRRIDLHRPVRMADSATSGMNTLLPRGLAEKVLR